MSAVSNKENQKLIHQNQASAFDQLLELAVLLCEMPTGMIALLDSDRYLLKAERGSVPPQITREFRLAWNTMASPEMLLIPDTRLDPQWQATPVFLGDREVRFYLGFPLVVQGKIVGFFCLIDSVPRGISIRQTKMLKIIASQICDQLDRERLQREVRALWQRTESMLPDPRVLAGIGRS